MVNCLLTLEVHGSASGESMKYIWLFSLLLVIINLYSTSTFFLIILQRSLTRNRGGGIGAAESLQKHLNAHTRAPIDAYQLYAVPGVSAGVPNSASQSPKVNQFGIQKYTKVFGNVDDQGGKNNWR